MTPRQILGVGIRLFAIVVALYGIGHFASAPKMLTSMALDDKAHAAYAVGTSYFLAALLALKAVPYLADGSRAQYQAIFTKLGPDINSIWQYLSAYGLSMYTQFMQGSLSHRP